MTLSEIKPSMNHDVTYGGHTYRLIGYILRKDKKTGEFFHQAELLDKSGNSTAVCRLEDVEVQDDIEATALVLSGELDKLEAARKDM